MAFIQGLLFFCVCFQCFGVSISHPSLLVMNLDYHFVVFIPCFGLSFTYSVLAVFCVFCVFFVGYELWFSTVLIIVMENYQFAPKKSGTPQRNDVVFVSPTGEEIKSKRQLEQYLKSHPGGPSASEFVWSKGILSLSQTIDWKCLTLMVVLEPIHNLLYVYLVTNVMNHLCYVLHRWYS